MSRQTLSTMLSAFLLGLFLYAALSKLINYPQFASQLSLHPLLKPYAALVAWLLPSVEIAVSVCLFIPAWRLEGLYAGLALLVIFSGYILGMLLMASHLPCSCGGILEHLSWKEHLYCNLAFMAVAFWCIRLERRLRKDRRLLKAYSIF